MSGTAPRGRAVIIALAAIAGVLLVAVVVVVVVLLTGERGDEAPVVTPPPTSPSPDPTTSPASTAPPPPPAAVAGVIPECTAMAPTGIPERVAAGEYVETQRDDAAPEVAETMPGPVAAQAVLDSPQVRFCSWYLQGSDVGGHMRAAVMTQEEWDRLGAALLESGWTAVEVDGAEAYMQVTGEGTLSGAPGEWWYIFESGVWIITGPEQSQALRDSTLAGVRAANP